MEGNLANSLFQHEREREKRQSDQIKSFLPSLLFQISFFSTSPELSNKQRFEYFSRTIPSDHYQTLAMAKIVDQVRDEQGNTM